jgi:hypothetical protein
LTVYSRQLPHLDVRVGIAEPAPTKGSKAGSNGP